jgi:hypothetical protein
MQHPARAGSVQRLRSASRSQQALAPGGFIGVALGEHTLIDQNSGVNFRLLTLYATWASLAWATALTGLAAAGNTWVLDRVAGGYFADDGLMPVWLRVAYGGMTLLMLAIARLAYLYFVNDVTRRQRNLGRLVVLLFALSTAVNAISQSQPERYNAIGAGVTMIGIAILRRRPKSNFVDLRLRH